MLHDREKPEHEEAAGAKCPMADCGALAVAYTLVDRRRSDKDLPWEFTCPRCGFDFLVHEEELVFRSVPKRWLLAEVQLA